MSEHQRSLGEEQELDHEIKESDRQSGKSEPPRSPPPPTPAPTAKAEKPEQPEKGDALLPVELAVVGKLPEDLQRSLLVRKQVVQVSEHAARTQMQIAAEMGRKTWGAILEDSTRKALARWADRYGIDPATELDVLGTQEKPEIYLRAVYYLRRLADLVASGLVEYAFADHVEAEPRLDMPEQDLPEDFLTQAREESSRRRYMRATFGIPEKATGATIFRVKLRNMNREVIGVAWCGGDTKRKVGRGGAVMVGDQIDPIGSVEPIKTSETRAARRAMRLLVQHVPVLRDRIVALEGDTEDITDRIRENHAAFEKQGPTKKIAAVSQEPGY